MDFLETIDWSEWSLPLAFIAAGLALGFALVSRLRAEDTSVAEQARQLDLRGEHAAALAALKALDCERSKLTDQDYTRERERLLARGAAALRTLDEGGAVEPVTEVDSDVVAMLRTLVEEVGEDAARSAATVVFGAALPSTPAPTEGGLAPEWRGALWALGIVAVIGGFGMYANTESVERRPGASMTGNQDLGGGDRKTELEARIEADPSDLAAMNELTILSIQAGDAPAAMEYNRRAFAIDAADPTAQTWKAVLAAAVGMQDRALQLLAGTVATHPDHVEAWTYKGLIELRMGRASDAVTSLERASALNPRDPQLAAALQQAQQVAAASGSGSPTATEATGPAEMIVKGTAGLPPEVQATLEGSETLYVSVRSPQGGPPLAAVKLPMAEWPRTFEVTTANAIAMGGRPRPVPDTLRVVVTVDGDGNPMSKDDVVATVDVSDVGKGTEDLQVTLVPPG